MKGLLSILGYVFFLATGCGSRAVEPLEEDDLDSLDVDGGLTEKNMEEPAQLRSLKAEGKPGLLDRRPKALCSLDAPLPGEVDGNLGAEELHALGQEYILSKDGASAIAVLLLAEKKAPENPGILGDLATALLQCRLYDEAIIRGEKAAELAKDDVDIIANLAQIYQIVGRLDDAISRYRSALEIDEADHAALNNLAVLLVG